MEDVPLVQVLHGRSKLTHDVSDGVLAQRCCFAGMNEVVEEVAVRHVLCDGEVVVRVFKTVNEEDDIADLPPAELVHEGQLVKRLAILNESHLNLLLLDQFDGHLDF